MTRRQTLLALAAATSFHATPAFAISHYWDGTDATADADGGSGTWETATPMNWDSAATAGTAIAWPGAGTDNDAVFAGSAGTVAIAAAGVTANDLAFQTTSYAVTGGALTLNNTGNNTISILSGLTASISAPITATSGAVTIAGPGTLNLSGDYTGTGRNFTVSGATLNLSSPAFAIKKFIVGAGVGSAPATLNLTSGTVTTTGDYVGVGDGINGTMNVQGGSLVLATGATALFLGTNANTTGTLNITSGSVTVNAGPLQIGSGYNGTQTTNSTGILSISGTGTYSHNSGSPVKLTNVVDQAGTVNLLTGGTFNINGQAITKGGGNATFNFDGGTLRSTAGTGNYFTGGLNPVINAGGANIDTNGFNATISTNLIAGTGNGGLVKKGNGFLGLGGANTFSGDVLVQGGQLIANAVSAIPHPEKVQVSTGAGYGVRLTGTALTEAEVVSLMDAADFSIGTFFAVDTGGGNTTLTTNAGTLTNQGNAIGLAKVGGNSLILDLAGQTFTGGISVAGGPLVLDTTGSKTYPGTITGNQTLNIQGAGNLTLTGTANIGQFNKFGTGIFTVADGALTLAANQNFFVHDGLFQQTGGSVNSGAYTVIGRTAGQTGEYAISGGTLNASGTAGVQRNAVIAEQGSTGILTINGGTVNATNSTAGSNIGGFFYGIIMAATAADNATLNLNGGTLLLSRVGTTFTPGTSTFNFNGGTLKANNGFLNFMQGLTRANVRNGGAVIDTNGNSLVLNQDLKHSNIPGDAAVDGGLTKLGAGLLELGGFDSDYTGKTTVGEGTLLMYSPTLADGSDLSIAAGATLDLQTGSTDTVRGLIIAGVPAAVGTWGALDSLDADFTTGAITGSGLIEVTQLATASKFDTWASAAGLAGPNALPSADPDKDGASNLLEFALKGDPTAGGNPGLTRAIIQDVSAPAGNELTLVVAVRDGAVFAAGSGGAQTATVDGIVYRVEGSLALGSFDSPVAHLSKSDTAPGMPSLAGTDWEYHTFKLTNSENLPGKGFLRVKVDAAP
ncbi:autotransporter-associated beta strand repeat-containing protein [Luteolibacter sp. GHJ8]|uniref:Autotransporter-associated beta strand repeat-containing protein n=1 Tax=Luteolibacter rhizosphaerae TaxID=2989719 RepID=A0ABT3G429_9BACT|nr:autotransporter-associated beta strand repeat-containing protein [Luteolibacter rhizosphaerae]MCW1914605.1 autotransporter-associated beta strand repeat-containing protein [Luteolibacter rhizosphaerae]